MVVSTRRHTRKGTPVAHLRYTYDLVTVRVVNIQGLKDLVAESIESTTGPNQKVFVHALVVMMNGDEYTLDLKVTKACQATNEPSKAIWLCEIEDVELSDGRRETRNAELTVYVGLPSDTQTGLVDIKFTS